ncbi:rnf149, partial [Symbiodinium microadriaticum]
MSAVSARSVKGCMERAMQAAYRQKPKPWQEDAICKTVAAWKDRQVFLFDHPRGSGKTKEMACMALVAFKYKDVQCVVVVSDRLDLASQTAKEMKDFFSHYPTRNGSKEKVPQVKQITAAWELEAEWEELAKGERLVLCVTLQCFPHVKEGKQLPECYQERTIVLADEVHRSHADKDPTIWFFIKSSQLASSGRHPPFFDRLYMQVMDRQQARQSESPVTEGGMRLLLSFRQLCCTAAALLVVGCTVVGLYSTVPIVSENTTVQQLLFVLAFVTMLVGCLAWMAFLRCYVLKQSPWSTEELRDIRPVQDHLWASVRFGDLEKATPDFRLQRIRQGCSHAAKREKASVLPTSVKGQETCLCCLDDFEDSHAVALLPCGHVFHEACISEWFLSARSTGACPICRQHLNI